MNKLEIPSLYIEHQRGKEGNSLKVSFFNTTGKEVTLTLFDPFGERIVSDSVESREIVVVNFPTTNLEPGLYSLLVEGHKLQVRRKVVFT